MLEVEKEEVEEINNQKATIVGNIYIDNVKYTPVEIYAQDNSLSEDYVISALNEGSLVGELLYNQWYVKIKKSNTINKNGIQVIERPIGIKIALFFLWTSFYIGSAVGLFAIISILTYDKEVSSSLQKALSQIELIIVISLIITWYIIKGIKEGINWVKILYIILVVVSILTFYSTLESIAWMNGIYRLNFILQTLFGIIISVGLLFPSSFRWFKQMEMKNIDSETIDKQTNSETVQHQTNEQKANNELVHQQTNQHQPEAKKIIFKADEIKKLAELKTEGLLTEKEFETEKIKILNS